MKVTITVKADDGSKVVLKAEDNKKGNIIDGWRNSKTGEMLTTESTFTTSWKVIKETEPEVVFHWDVSKFETTDAEVILLKTLGAHVAMPKSTKYTNVKSITLNKSEVTIAKGKTFQVTAKSTAENAKKTIVTHVSEYRYEMSKKGIVSVSKKGVIKGLKKGTCTVYVIANNGVRKGIKVTVK